MASDYSPTLRNVANRLTNTGRHVERVGRLVIGLRTGASPGPSTPIPTPVRPGPHPGTHLFDGVPVADWIWPIVKWARDHGWNGRVTSGYRSVAEQREACRHVCGNPDGCPGRCAKPGQSEHQFVEYPRGAVDVTFPGPFGIVLRDYPGGPPLRNDLPADRVHYSHSGH